MLTLRQVPAEIAERLLSARIDAANLQRERATTPEEVVTAEREQLARIVALIESKRERRRLRMRCAS